MATRINHIDLLLDIDHGQFFIEDARIARHSGETVERFTLQGFRAVAPALQTVRTFRQGGHTKISLSLYDERPSLPPNRYDRIQLCSLDLSSGTLRLCADDMPEHASKLIQFPAAIYQLLICSSGWETITDMRERDGADAYHIMLWPGEAIEPILIHNCTPFA